MNRIESFRGSYAFLSNFHPAKVPLGRWVFCSSEHAFQAMKTTNEWGRTRIMNAKTAAEARRLGRGIAKRPDWECVREQIMYDIVLLKFATNPELAEKLVATGNAELIEGNTWGDTFWGVCRGVGENRLGAILMRVRKRLR